jgi:hypothetical protein
MCCKTTLMVEAIVDASVVLILSLNVRGLASAEPSMGVLSYR